MNHVPLYEQRHIFNPAYNQKRWHKNEHLKAVASINARMGSSRLPGKVLMDIEGKPLLTRIVDRLRRCTALYDIVLATTTLEQDDCLIEWAESLGIRWWRGEVDDVLKRTVDAHRMMESDYVIRVCGDTPLIDPETVDYEILALKNDWYDFIYSTNDRKFPHGTTAHACKFSDLEWIEQNITDPTCREHVTWYFYAEAPEKYRIHKIIGASGWKCEGQRLQVDYQEDLDVVRIVQREVSKYYGDEVFPVGKVVHFLNSPYGKKVRQINANCEETVMPEMKT